MEQWLDVLDEATHHTLVSRLTKGQWLEHNQGQLELDAHEQRSRWLKVAYIHNGFSFSYKEKSRHLEENWMELEIIFLNKVLQTHATFSLY